MKHGSLSKTNLEWGSKARKEEDNLRGLNNRARREHIAEQLIDCPSCYGRPVGLCPDCGTQGDE